MSTRGLGVVVAALAIAALSASDASGNARRGRASGARLARQLSRHPIRERHGWSRYDEAPTNAVVRPLRVLQVAGNVTNPQALSHPGSGQTTTLTYLGGTQPSLVLDYGRDVGGTATFDIAATTGTTIQTTYSETLANLGNDGASTVGLFHSGNGQRTDSFPAATPGVVTAPLIQGGERYERVTLTTPGTVTLRSAAINFSPLRETPSVMRGHFLSSDDLLNRIWYAGAYTLNLNQMTPGTTVEPGAVNGLHLILDGAKRDRAVWSGDHVISDLTDYYASDPVWARDSNSLFLEHPASEAGAAVPAEGDMSQPGPLPGACTPNVNLDHYGCVTWSATYSMVVMTALYHYYLYTGDRRFVRQHWQAVVRQMEWDAQHIGSDGLFSVTAHEGADWNVDVHSGEPTYVNAVYVQALRSTAKLAAALGHRAQAKEWSAAATAVTKAVNRQLWNPKTHVYDASTSQRGAVVQDANVTAILAGIAGRSRARRILKVLQRRLGSKYGPLDVSSPAPSGYTQHVSPYMGSFHVLADLTAGDEAAALSTIRREWGFMIRHDPGGVEWERIQPNGIPAGGPIADSSAHAWSTGPTAALSMYVLGVRPASPGYRHWTVGPQPGDLRWAQGVVQTRRGPIGVRWRRKARKLFVLTVLAPRGTSGKVAVPLLRRGGTIARSGKIVWSHNRPAPGVHAHRVGTTVVFAQHGGRSTYAWVR